MRPRSSGGLVCLMVILMAAAISGCAPVKVRPLVVEQDKEEQIQNQGTVAARNGHTGQNDKLTVSLPLVKPTTVARGDKLSYRVTYTLSSSDPKKEFEVVDVIVLSGPGLVVELSRKTYKKPQGSHISNLDFTVPPGLPPGSYKLISTIRAAGQEKQQRCNFMVKGKEND
jgi:hypothetical protein